MRKEIAVLVALFVLLAGILFVIADSAVREKSENTDVTGGFVSSFSNKGELFDFLKKTFQDSNQSGQGSYFDSRTVEWSSSDMTLGFGAKSESSGPSYSETNVQVQGIDEDDFVKTDGEYIFVATSKNVTIIKAYPPDKAEIVGTISALEILENYSSVVDMYMRSIFVNSNKIVIISSATILGDKMVESYSGYEKSRIPFTMVSVIDITDIDNPLLLNSYGVSGYFSTARMSENHVYAISNYNIWRWSFADDFNIPQVMHDDKITDFEPNKIVYDPECTDSQRYLDLMAIDLSSDTMNYLSILSSSSTTTYMSKNALYLTFLNYSYNIWADEPFVTIMAQNGLSTKIFKVDIEGLSMTFSAKGEVTGRLLNQFSMDEHESFLRVATTTDWSDLENNVYVLNGTDLDIIGSLEGLAPTERIYSARFIGDTLYLVTFRQIDPFFVIDLSSPEAPKVLGELKIPGFSSYLHPVDENHILGIGQENRTVKVSLFDVSDPMNPVEQSKMIVNDVSPLWSRDHKAVLFDYEKELLVFPIMRYGSYYGAGACVMNVSTDDGIEFRGIIDHDIDYELRALYIGDYLYTVSNSMVKINHLEDLTEIDSIVYNEGYNYYWYY